MFSSFNRDRLRRSKSIRSIRRVPRVPEEPFDPELAKKHAAAAAFHAMRSSDKSAIDPKTSYDRLGGPAHVAVPRRPNSSLRFTDNTLSVCSGPIAQPVTPRESMERPDTSLSQRLKESEDLPPTTDFRGLDGRDSSLPSSYRRLRKAKSMFTTRQRSSHLSYGLPRDSYDADHSPRHELPRTLRPSISFMRGNKGRTVRHAKSQDAAIQLARHQFLEEANATQPRRSSFFTSRLTREHKPFRKTFRIASGSGIGGESPEQPLHRRARSKSRILSASIKHGLKRVFGLSKPVDRQSGLKAEDSSNGPEDPVFDCHLGGQTADLETQDYIAVPPLPTIQSSLSQDTPCTSASRVTSWADSSVATTVVARKNGHRQSLSLIEEHGDLNKELPQLPLSNGREDQVFLSRGTSDRRLDAMVNSQDLYTALMQQIGQTAGHNPDEAIHFGTVPEHRVIPERTYSAYSRSRRSIRHVQSGDSTPVSFTTAHRGDSQSPQRQPQSIGHVPLVRASRCSFEGYQPTIVYPATKSPRFGRIINEDLESDEDTGSVIMARAAPYRSISPSVYSRTVSGHTLNKPCEGNDSDEPTFFAEPGTATIYSSQRHSSPTRATLASPKAKSQPSADWQQWMNSQIDRIENASPTRGHYREGAQAQADDDEVFMGLMRRAPPEDLQVTGVPYIFNADELEYGVQPLAESKMHMQNNFSRPFSRSSSVRTIMPSQKIEAMSVPLSSNPADTDPDTSLESLNKTPALPARSPLRPLTANGATHKSSSPADTAATADVARHVESSPPPSRSPMRLRTVNVPEVPDSPTPNGSLNRVWTHDQHRRYSVRRPIANGRQPQFRSMRNYRDFRPFNNENTQDHEHDDMMDDYHKLGELQTSLSSKHMVEMFLNSRRRPADTPAEKNAGEAFI